jgi:hypothetical protein
LGHHLFFGKHADLQVNERVRDYLKGEPYPVSGLGVLIFIKNLLPRSAET